MTKPTLTNRQKQVLRLATHPNKYIASTLGISQGTVRQHFTDIFAALDLGPLRTRTAAVATALQHGIINLDDISISTRERP